VGKPAGKEQVTLYLEPETKAAIQEIARLRKRSMQSLIEIILDSVVEDAKREGKLEG